MSRYKGKHRAGNTGQVQYHTGGHVQAGRVVFPPVHDKREAIYRHDHNLCLHPSPRPEGMTETVTYVGDMAPGGMRRVTFWVSPKRG